MRHTGWSPQFLAGQATGTSGETSFSLTPDQRAAGQSSNAVPALAVVQGRSSRRRGPSSEAGSSVASSNPSVAYLTALQELATAEQQAAQARVIEARRIAQLESEAREAEIAALRQKAFLCKVVQARSHGSASVASNASNRGGGRAMETSGPAASLHVAVWKPWDGDIRPGSHA